MAKIKKQAWEKAFETETLRYGVPVEKESFVPLLEDIKFLFGNTSPSREQVLKVIVHKFRVLNDLQLIKEFLKYMVDHERHLFLVSNNNNYSLELLFQELKDMVLVMPSGAEDEMKEQLIRLLVALHNSAFLNHRGRYFLQEDMLLDLEGGVVLSATERETADDYVYHFAYSLHTDFSEPGKKPINVNEQLLSIAEVARKLGCSRPTVYNKHIKKNGLKTVRPTGAEGEQKVRRTDLYSYMEQLV